MSEDVREAIKSHIGNLNRMLTKEKYLSTLGEHALDVQTRYKGIDIGTIIEKVNLE